VLQDDVEDRDDVRVVQRGDDPRLAHHPLARERHIGHRLVGQPHLLEGHLAAQQLVGGPPDGAHATGPDELAQPVAARDRSTVRGPEL
jgi:hypothetical protein